MAYFSQLFCHCVIGYGRPGPKGDKGDPGNFVPNSGWITAYARLLYIIVMVLWFLKYHSFTNVAYTGTFFAGPPGPPGPTGPKGATGQSYLQLEFC